MRAVFLLSVASACFFAFASPIQPRTLVWTGDPTVIVFYHDYYASAGAIATDTGMDVGASCLAVGEYSCLFQAEAVRDFTVTSETTFVLSTSVLDSSVTYGVPGYEYSPGTSPTLKANIGGAAEIVDDSDMGGGDLTLSYGKVGSIRTICSTDPQSICPLRLTLSDSLSGIVELNPGNYVLEDSFSLSVSGYIDPDSNVTFTNDICNRCQHPNRVAV